MINYSVLILCVGLMIPCIVVSEGNVIDHLPDAGRNQFQVAICVTGQVARMIPSLLIPFLRDNSKFRFTLFYVLQTTKQKPWKGAIYQEPRYINLTVNEIHTELSKLYSSLRNVLVAAVNDSAYLNLNQWKNKLHGKVIAITFNFSQVTR